MNDTNHNTKESSMKTPSNSDIAFNLAHQLSAAANNIMIAGLAEDAGKPRDATYNLTKALSALNSLESDLADLTTTIYRIVNRR